MSLLGALESYQAICFSHLEETDHMGAPVGPMSRSGCLANEATRSFANGLAKDGLLFALSGHGHTHA
jgi:hypothetical protein